MARNRSPYLGRTELAAEAKIARRDAKAMEFDEVKIAAAWDQLKAWLADKRAGRLPMIAPGDRCGRGCANQKQIRRP